MSGSPGMEAAHVWITDESRKNRGEAGALDEALARIRSEAEACMAGWVGKTGVRFHIVLSVETPTALAEHHAARMERADEPTRPSIPLGERETPVDPHGST